jgi:hypothetical protein
MHRIHKSLLFTLITILPLLCYSQYYDLPILNQKDIKSLDKHIIASLSKCRCYTKKTKWFTFFVLTSTDTISKEEYADGSFLKKLKHEYYYQSSFQWCTDDENIIEKISDGSFVKQIGHKYSNHIVKLHSIDTNLIKQFSDTTSLQNFKCKYKIKIIKN